MSYLKVIAWEKKTNNLEPIYFFFVKWSYQNWNETNSKILDGKHF